MSATNDQSDRSENKSVFGAWTIKEVCDQLSVSRATVYRMIKAGQLEKITVGTRGARIPVASVSALLATHSAEH